MKRRNTTYFGRKTNVCRIGVALSATILALIAVCFEPESASAAEFKTGDSPSVKTGETVKGDLYLFGGNADIIGNVTGDAIVAAGSLDMTGKVDGSLSVLGGDVEIKGTVGRSLRVAGGKVVIRGTIGGDVVMASGSVTLETTGKINGDLVVSGGEVKVLGPVAGNIRGNVGKLELNSPVGGSVKVRSDDLHLRSKAKVTGALDYTSRKEAKIDDGANVTGKRTREEPSRFYPGDNVASWLTSPIFRLLCALVAGVALVLLIPRAMAIVADGIRIAPAASFILGLILLFLVPVLILILLVTVVGIPVALILFAAYLGVLYLSQVFLGLALGRMVLPRSWDTSGRGYNLLAMTIGVVVLAGLRLIPLPFVGVAIAVITAIFGLGAVILGPRRMRGQAMALPRY